MYSAWRTDCRLTVGVFVNFVCGCCCGCFVFVAGEFCWVPRGRFRRGKCRMGWLSTVVLAGPNKA